MRIISKTHDYYDCIQAQGQDRRLVYMREERELEGNWFSSFSTGRGFHLPYNHDPLTPYVVGFCGNVYPMVRAQWWGAAGLGKPIFCYSAAEVDEAISAHGSREEQAAHCTKRYFTRRWRGLSRIRNGQEAVAHYFSNMVAAQGKHRPLFEELRAPVFVAHRLDRWRRGGAWEMTVNGCLKDVQFYRVFDTFRAFQEISMYLGGLASPEKVIPEISDEIMAEAKGFNRFSFRKERTTTKRR